MNRVPKATSTLRGGVAALLLSTLLLAVSCGFVPYDEASLKGYLFSEELSEIAEIGPASFDAATENDGDRLPRPQQLHPIYPFGDAGYAIWREENSVYAYYVGGSSSSQLTDQWIENQQLASAYVARAANVVEDPNNPAEKPLLLAPFQDGFGRIDIYNDEGLIDEIDLVDLLTSAGFAISNPTIVGIYFRAVDDGSEEIAILARENDAATFKEAYFTIGAAGTLAGPVVPGGGTFTLPNLTDDILIYNVAFIRDPVNDFNYLTVQDDFDYITYRWDEDNPATSQTEIPIGGVISHATPEGTLMVKEGDKLVEYDSDGGILGSHEPGTIAPLGLYWTGSSVEELYSAVGVSLGMPEPRISAKIYRR